MKTYFDILKFDPVNNYYLYDKSELVELKKNIDKEFLKSFINDMEELFTWPLESVVSKKQIFDNNHDYVSLGTYWWPDETKENGLPYIQKDGYANPEGLDYDKDKFRRLAYLTYHAGILYYLTNDKKYKDLIQKHLHNWFLNKDTMMNPNMNHGQFVPGKVDGRAEGIIDYTANFAYALNILDSLFESNMFDENITSGILDWHKKFHNWLLTDKIAIDELHAKNNHGTFYDFGIMVIEKFIKDETHLEQRRNNLVEKRIKEQILEDGSLPYELARTKSVSYTYMGLKGLIDIAKLLNQKGINVFDKLEKSIDWLYNTGLINFPTWKYIQVTPVDHGIFYTFWNLINNIYGNKYIVNKYVNDDLVINKVLMYLHKK